MNDRLQTAMRRLKQLQQDAVYHLRRTADATHEQVTPLVERAQDESRKLAETAIKEAKKATKFPL